MGIWWSCPGRTRAVSARCEPDLVRNELVDDRRPIHPPGCPSPAGRVPPPSRQTRPATVGDACWCRGARPCEGQLLDRAGLKKRWLTCALSLAAYRGPTSRRKGQHEGDELSTTGWAV